MANALPNVGKASRYGDLKRRLLFLLAALVVFRIGAHIPVPGIDPHVLGDLFKDQQGGLLGMFRITTVTTLVTGTMFLMWLGEQITERGLGNGISIIIFAGIAAGLPNAVAGTLELVRTGAMHPLTALLIAVAVIVVTAFVCFV